MKRDNIYSKNDKSISSFVFDEKVVNVFEDMINRSVPGYGAIITMLGYLADEYVKENTNCYDLGCALGASALSIADKVNKAGAKIIAVDNSKDMVESCKKIVDEQDLNVDVDVVCDDIENVDIVNASMVVLTFTLQFFDPVKRAGLIEKIYDGMVDGGILVLSEKVVFDDDKEQELHTQMYYEFKRLNGYSEMEISNKRTALENVLIPDTFDEHKARLKEAGFSQVYKWFQCFNFISIVAVK